MGRNLFGANISKIIKDVLGPSVLDAVLTKVSNTGVNPADPTGAPVTSSTDYACRGFIDSQDRRAFNGTLIQDGTRVVVLLGDTISGGSVSPTTADTITIEGTEFSIVAIDRDPDAATYQCVVRPL
jgi:hypothetical protein